MSMTKGSQKILDFRAANNLTQEALGLRLGVTKQAVQNWEAGRNTPDLINYIAMRVAGIPVQETDFLNGPGK